MSSKYSPELFMEACGTTGPLTLLVEDSSRPGGSRKVFHQPFAVIGRDPLTDLMLDHRRVSRRHAYLQMVAGRLFCMDLGSRTGIEWDDGSRESGWLDAGKKVTIGAYTISLRVTIDSDELGRQLDPAKADEEGGSNSYGIDFVSSPGRQPPIRLGHSLALVGSSPECRVRIPYSDVSKAHCALLRSPQGIWVVDLLGDGGTYVNNTHVKFSRLDDGDELRVGKHLLKFRFDMFSKPSFSPVSQGHAMAEVGSSSELKAISRPPVQAEPAPEHQGLPAVQAMPGVPMATTWTYPTVEVQNAVGAQLPAVNQTELIQALMQPMMQQFSLMQQQMFEQFHQAMMGMFQSFGNAYREKIGELREEIEEVRRITQELHELQTQAAQGNRPSPAPPPASPATAPTSTSTVYASRYSIPDPTARSRPKPSVSVTGPIAAPKIDPDEIPFRKQPLNRANSDVHSVLTERIASLQNERQSRWQKILAKLNKSN